ncbi:DNA polymerase/3'-5' exonuclease PolX [bacterium]|nr:DNA polymerase/3'-5' exonuclease PolX [bacterium]
MANKELSKIFSDISNFLKAKGVSFKPYAYQKVALLLDSLEEDVGEIYKNGGINALMKIPGVGESIAKKIEEYLKTGKIKYYEALKSKTPVKMGELTSIEGVGPKMVEKLYKYLQVCNLKDLEEAAKKHKIRELPGFQEKTEQNILEGIAFLRKSKGRFLLGEILPIVRSIKERIEAQEYVQRVDICGSIRRRKETIGDADLLVESSHPAKIIDYFVSLPDIAKVYAKGPTKAMVMLKNNLHVDLRAIPKRSYGAALQYFTGSKDHNIVTRKIAIEKGLKLNEYGLFRGKKKIAGGTEEGIYKALGMDWMPPEIRENTGEIELSLKHKTPHLIGYHDVRGDLHCHTKWDGGNNSILEMAEEAMKLGYEYLGISDHTKALKIEHGLNEKQLLQQRKEIDKLNAKFQMLNTKFKILQGAETNILKDGSIDIKEEALSKLDYAIAGVHAYFKMSRAQMTERIIKAMRNPYIKIIAHPTGRILKKRDNYKIDFNKVLKMAKATGTILEINSQPERLDLDAQNIRKAKEAGVKMIINTDAHYKSHLHYMELGISQARRGWAEKKDIVNTYPLRKFLRALKKAKL